MFLTIKNLIEIYRKILNYVIKHLTFQNKLYYITYFYDNLSLLIFKSSETAATYFVSIFIHICNYELLELCESK